MYVCMYVCMCAHVCMHACVRYYNAIREHVCRQGSIHSCKLFLTYTQTHTLIDTYIHTLQVAKLQYVLTIKEIPTIEGRNAELALWRRRHEEAEGILLQVSDYTCMYTMYTCMVYIRVYMYRCILETAARRGRGHIAAGM
jgi:hypothetical protein